MAKEFPPKNKFETFSTPRRSDEGLSLEYVKGIKFGDAFITPQKIQTDAEKSISEIKGNKELSQDEKLIRWFCRGKLPFTITGDRSIPEPVTLIAQTFRFPYSIDGREGFAEHAIRLMPEPGEKIEKVELNEYIWRTSFPTKIVGMTATPEGVLMEYDGGQMQAEVKFSHQDNLLPMKPSKGFKKNVVTPKD